MPPKAIKTFEEEIFYEYAKLISRAAFSGAINFKMLLEASRGAAWMYPVRNRNDLAPPSPMGRGRKHGNRLTQARTVETAVVQEVRRFRAGIKDDKNVF